MSEYVSVWTVEMTNVKHFEEPVEAVMGDIYRNECPFAIYSNELFLCASEFKSEFNISWFIKLVIWNFDVWVYDKMAL